MLMRKKEKEEERMLKEEHAQTHAHTHAHTHTHGFVFDQNSTPNVVGLLLHGCCFS